MTSTTASGQIKYVSLPIMDYIALSTFQTLLNGSFNEYKDRFIMGYIDEIPIFREDKKSRYKHAENLLELLQYS